jgi:sugar phosphate isomerase/epimerase
MRFAICQELFEGWDWERQCRFIAQTGYTGIEVAPFTMAPLITDVSAAERKHRRDVAADHGLEIIGLHWLLAKTTGLHLTSDSAVVRQKTSRYLADLATACADMGGTLMVLGSPLQRNLAEGVSYQVGLDRAADVLRGCTAVLADRNVRLCVEPLTTVETNFLNTCAEGVELVRRVDHPNVVLHQDVKAMLGESTPIPDLVRQFAGVTHHFHANDGNKLGPGMGPTDFHPIFAALRDTGYSGWVSVEVFDYSPGCEQIARESLRYMQQVWRDVAR